MSDQFIPDLEESLAYVRRRWPDVEDSGVIPEIIVWALNAMRADPTLTIEKAFEEGCYEWDV